VVLDDDVNVVDTDVEEQHEDRAAAEAELSLRDTTTKRTCTSKHVGVLLVM